MQEGLVACDIGGSQIRESAVGITQQAFGCNVGSLAVALVDAFAGEDRDCLDSSQASQSCEEGFGLTEQVNRLRSSHAVPLKEHRTE